MRNQWGSGHHFIFVSFLTMATIYTGMGAPNTTVGCSKEERLALLKFKHTVRDELMMLSSWVGNDCCQWERVYCDDVTGNVVGLSLRGSRKIEANFLHSGSISNTNDDYYYAGKNCRLVLVGDEVDSSLAELRHLEYLDLSGNNFNGSRIPEFIGSLKKLRYLNLSNSAFDGVIPHNIGNLSSLKVLDLSAFSYTQLKVDDMAWLSRLSSLERLVLRSVVLSGARNRAMLLYMIPSLIELNLRECGLTNADLGPRLNLSRSLPNIKHLDLSQNFIGGEFPSVLTNMSSLASLDLSETLLNSSTPVMPNLLKLDLSGNMYKRIEHVEIWRQCYLKEFIVTNTRIGEEMVGPSTNVSQCSQYALEELYFEDNLLNGSIPEAIRRLTKLRVLHLGSNRLAGLIPEALGSLRSLEVLDLSSNWLNGPIPACLGRLASLKVFSVLSNFLNGTIPISVGQLRKLDFLDISQNSFTGFLSEAHFASLSMLKYLDAGSNSKLIFNVSRQWIPPFQLKVARLGSCKILGGLPQWLQTQKNLEELVLSNASISGPLPTWFQKMHIISILDLSHNNLHGPLKNLPSRKPSCGFRYEYHESLLLQNNLFSGSIPRSFCKRTNLTILDISRNRLTGKIPDCLGNLRRLYKMLFSSNELSGVFPRSLGQLSWLEWLKLDDNKLIGELPQELNQSDLRVLDLGGNKFSGYIPKWIGEISTGLMVLRLHKNNFTGRIPRCLCKLSLLQILDVAHNKLTGSIPRCLGKLNNMVTVTYMFEYMENVEFDENVIQVIKGTELQYTTTLELVINMDLSSNKLIGEIPKELTLLSRLMGLNLSHNHLSGSIPKSIGNMKELTSLDLSENKLTGVIPLGMAALNFLSHLNLSHNNLTGQIPTGNQLRTLIDPSIYAGNKDLCGIPLPKSCSNHKDPMTSRSKNTYKEAHWQKKVWLYLDIMSGFATGFWGIIGVLLFNKTWRHKLFRFSEVNMDKIYVAFMVRVAKMKRGKP